MNKNSFKFWTSGIRRNRFHENRNIKFKWNEYYIYNIYCNFTTIIDKFTEQQFTFILNI